MTLSHPGTNRRCLGVLVAGGGGDLGLVRGAKPREKMKGNSWRSSLRQGVAKMTGIRGGRDGGWHTADCSSVMVTATEQRKEGR
jgi:hypothetical protein